MSDTEKTAEKSKFAITQKELRSRDEIEMEQKMVKIIDKMPKSVKSRFQVLHMLSDERSKINDDFEAEVAKLHAKINAAKQPKHELRAQMLAGEVTDFAEYSEPYDARGVRIAKSMEEITATSSEAKLAKDKEEAESHKPTDVAHLADKKGVPDFWKKVVTQHFVLQTLFSEKDLEVLEHLTAIRVTEDVTDKPTEVFACELDFSENAFFTNDKLTFTVK